MILQAIYSSLALCCSLPDYWQPPLLLFQTSSKKRRHIAPGRLCAWEVCCIWLGDTRLCMREVTVYIRKINKITVMIAFCISFIAFCDILSLRVVWTALVTALVCWLVFDTAKQGANQLISFGGLLMYVFLMLIFSKHPTKVSIHDSSPFFFLLSFWFLCTIALGQLFKKVSFGLPMNQLSTLPTVYGTCLLPNNCCAVQSHTHTTKIIQLCACTNFFYKKNSTLVTKMNPVHLIEITPVQSAKQRWSYSKKGSHQTAAYLTLLEFRSKEALCSCGFS